MKRIASKVAIETITYIIRGNEYIRIVDYPNSYELSNDDTPDCSKGTVVFDDQVSGKSYRDGRWFASQVRGIKPYHIANTGIDILIFQICTKEDQY